MSLWQSIPFACILLPLAAAALTAALPTRRARYVTGFVLLVQTVLSALLVGVRPEDFGDTHPLAGFVLQRAKLIIHLIPLHVRYIGIIQHIVSM